jgi:hypothetical protein
MATRRSFLRVTTGLGVGAALGPLALGQAPPILCIPLRLHPIQWGHRFRFLW